MIRSVIFLIILIIYFAVNVLQELLRKVKIESKKIMNEGREDTDNTKDMQSQDLHSLYPFCI